MAQVPSPHMCLVVVSSDLQTSSLQKALQDGVTQKELDVFRELKRAHSAGMKYARMRVAQDEEDIAQNTGTLSALNLVLGADVPSQLQLQRKQRGNKFKIYYITTLQADTISTL